MASNLDPATVAACADALAAADAATLCEMAHDALSYIEYRDMTPHGANSMRTLAALALAVAAMQERRLGLQHSGLPFGRWVDITDTGIDEGIEGDTVTAALAALLRTAPTSDPQPARMPGTL